MDNKNKSKTAKMSRRDRFSAAEKSDKRTSIFITCFAIAAVIAIACTVIFAMIIPAIEAKNEDKRRQEHFSFDDDMSKYLTIPKDAYTAIDVYLGFGEPEAAALEDEITKLLYSKRDSETKDDNNGDFYRDVEIQYGYDVYIYYNGFYMKDEERVYFTGGCNLNSSIYKLGIGSGSFIDGFESGLVGKNPTDYVSLISKGKIDKNATVADGDLVYITYDYLPFSGPSEKDKTAVIDLGEDVDAKWGEGFKEYLIGTKVGTKISTDFVYNKVEADGNTQSDAYSGVTVNQIYTPVRTNADGEPLEILTVNANFPDNYDSEEVRGKEATFEVYVAGVEKYELPTFDEEFITETLKVKEEDLADYEGETIVDKYTKKLEADIQKQYEEDLESYKEDVLNSVSTTLFDILLDKASIKKIPEGDVLDNYDSIYNIIVSNYNYYNQVSPGTYKDLDAYAISYFNLKTGDDWLKELRRQAEEAVIKQIAFYYVIKDLHLVPSDEDRDARSEELYNETFDTVLEQSSGIHRDDYDSDEEYDEAVEDFKTNTFDKQYTKEYFDEQARYELALEMIRDEICTLHEEAAAEK